MRNRKKILMLIPELGYGGAEKSLVRVAKHLSGRHEVKVVVFQRQYARGGYAAIDENHPFQIVELDRVAEPGMMKRWARRWRLLRSLKSDSAVTISFLTGANILNVLSGGPTRNVVSMQGSRKYDPNLGAISRYLYLWIIDPLVCLLSDRAVMVSRGVECETGGVLKPVIRGRTMVIPPMIDAHQMANMACERSGEKFDNGNKAPVVVSAGRMSPEKGFDHLIRVFAKVRAVIPEARLVLIGDGPQLDSLMSLCRSLGLKAAQSEKDIKDAAVLFTGYRKNPVRLFHEARVFVLSSLTEGLPNVLIEALASGIPVVANDAPWGARAVLCEQPDESCKPYVANKPMRVDYGTLMPRIDRLQHEEDWVDVLVSALTESKRDRKQAERNQSRMWQFDQNIIGRHWLRLIDEL